eukprot:TRINITY_DN41237_c0_g1_i1.p1 TRINITY_DN41237_c0_g1~~TRINITY_DN41237_c0_g1_i1.p1  ORF type:complete len:306 (-),score=90.69 TRINITY_DN41237_c0_g1_i1:47-847(-)
MAETFGYAAHDEQYGAYFEWPQYNDHLTDIVNTTYSLYQNWKAFMVCSAYTPEEQDAIRTKIKAYDIFNGQKPWDGTRSFQYDYLSQPSMNINVDAWNAMRHSLPLHGSIVMTFGGIKVSSKHSLDERAVVVTDSMIYKLDPKKFALKKDELSLDDLSRISLSSNPDTYAVLHFKAPARDLVMDLGLRTDLVAEFVTCLYKIVEARGRELDIEFVDSTTFNNQRKNKKVGKTVSLSWAPMPQPHDPVYSSKYKKMTAEAGVVHWRN